MILAIRFLMRRLLQRREVERLNDLVCYADQHFNQGAAKRHYVLDQFKRYHMSHRISEQTLRTTLELVVFARKLT